MAKMSAASGYFDRETEVFGSGRPTIPTMDDVYSQTELVPTSSTIIRISFIYK